MSGYVVDASVAVKWVLDEDYTEQAMTLLSTPRLIAPDHWLAEATNAVWTRFFRKLLTADQAKARAAALLGCPVQGVPLMELASDAFGLAITHGITVYDALYVTLAQKCGLPFVCDDRKLVGKLRLAGMQNDAVLWVADLV